MPKRRGLERLAAMKEAKAAQEAADLEKSAAAPAVVSTEMLESRATRLSGALTALRSVRRANLKNRPLKPMSGWSAHRYLPT
jgi:hypothetical protein